MNLAWSLFLLLFLGGGGILTGMALALLKDKRKGDTCPQVDKETDET